MKKSLPFRTGGTRTGPDQDMVDKDLREQVAVEILTYLGQAPDRLDRFFAVTGLGVDTLRQAAGSRDFSAHLLDYLASDERLLMAFASASGRDPAAIETIRLALAPRDCA